MSRDQEWPMDNNMMRKIWVGMSTTNIHSFQFKIKSYLQNAEFDWQCIGTHTEEKPSKISNITFAILSLSHKSNLTKLPYWVLWSLYIFLHETIRCASKLFILTQKNAKFIDRESQVCYLRITHSFALNRCFASLCITSAFLVSSCCFKSR